MKSIVALIVSIIGVASIVLGIVFIMQAGSGMQQIADEMAPVKIADIDATYDSIAAKHGQMAAMEEPKIQAGQAAASATYNYLFNQRNSFGLARTNVGVVNFIRTSGIVDIVLGSGLLLAGIMLFQKTPAKA
jgi:hypothetical protein